VWLMSLVYLCTMYASQISGIGEGSHLSMTNCQLSISCRRVRGGFVGGFLQTTVRFAHVNPMPCVPYELCTIPSPHAPCIVTETDAAVPIVGRTHKGKCCVIGLRCMLH
jgi:hypothetical protein